MADPTVLPAGDSGAALAKKPVEVCVVDAVWSGLKLVVRRGLPS